MMNRKIEKKIVAYEVIDIEEQRKKSKAEADAHIQHMQESISRPEMLLGATYKIKTPMSEHALYVTINDMVLNEGTKHEVRRPFEVFINSKNMEQFQWVVALTRVISAVFRKGGDVTFLVDEMKAVFDPQGGYFKPGGRYMPSLVAEIGYAIESHMKMIGMIQDEELSDIQKEIMDQKRKEYEALKDGKKSSDGDAYPPGAQLCNKCHNMAVVIMDGCSTCLSCGDSKCG